MADVQDILADPLRRASYDQNRAAGIPHRQAMRIAYGSTWQYLDSAPIGPSHPLVGHHVDSIHLPSYHPSNPSSRATYAEMLANQGFPFPEAVNITSSVYSRCRVDPLNLPQCSIQLPAPSIGSWSPPIVFLPCARHFNFMCAVLSHPADKWVLRTLFTELGYADNVAEDMVRYQDYLQTGTGVGRLRTRRFRQEYFVRFMAVCKAQRRTTTVTAPARPTAPPMPTTPTTSTTPPTPSPPRMPTPPPSPTYRIRPNHRIRPAAPAWVSPTTWATAIVPSIPPRTPAAAVPPVYQTPVTDRTYAMPVRTSASTSTSHDVTRSLTHVGWTPLRTSTRR